MPNNNLDAIACRCASIESSGSRYLWKMKYYYYILAILLVAVCGCVSSSPRMSQVEFRTEFKKHKEALFSAKDIQAEAKALTQMGTLIKESQYYGYRLSAPSQPSINGVNVDRLQPNEPVTLHLYARSDYEPRTGGFEFTPKQKENLFLLEGKIVNDQITTH